MEYNKLQINNRRYLGNKYKLLPFISGVISDECKNVKSVADIFAGTGSFAYAFRDKKVITNDILYSNYVSNVAWFGNEEIDVDKIDKIIEGYNEKKYVNVENYMTVNFSDTFFSKSVCAKIGEVREDIEMLYNNKKINMRERAALVSSLLYSIDKIANTCGHYDAYIRNKDLPNEFLIKALDVDNNNNKNNVCYNMDANDLVKSIKVDLVYIDPPYNSRQYCDAYHLLENVARWQKPEVYGIAKKMNRDEYKSKYCTREAKDVFADLIKNTMAKYIILSYNNTGNKANERSNARISDEDIMRILEEKGKVKVFNQKYKAFTAGKSDNNQNVERLFLCIV